jgi:hypothetical protein
LAPEITPRLQAGSGRLRDRWQLILGRENCIVFTKAVMARLSTKFVVGQPYQIQQ